MKRAWGLLEYLFPRSKKPKIEEKRGHFIDDKEPTELGKLINDLFYHELPTDWAFKTDRGYRVSCYVTYTFPEIKNHYRGDRERDFEIGIISAWDEEDRSDRIASFVTAAENQIMYYLMKEHGVSYEAAYNFIQDLFETNYYDCFDEVKTNQNVRDKLNNDPLCEELCEKISFLHGLAEEVSNMDGYYFRND